MLVDKAGVPAKAVGLFVVIIPTLRFGTRLQRATTIPNAKNHITVIGSEFFQRSQFALLNLKSPHRQNQKKTQ